MFAPILPVMLGKFLIGLFTVVVVSLASHGLWWQLAEHPRSWAHASWSSAGVLPPARAYPDAVVHVMAGRTGRWKGIFAHHSWIVVKDAGGARYTRYDVVGWGTALRTDAYAADGRWYGNSPEILLTLKGRAAEQVIPRIRQAVANYPFAARGAYTIWPGPNSNTFVASVARAVPELAPALLPTAIGKDYAGWPVFVGAAPSQTGVQLSIGGVLGATVAWVEGLEINLLGFVTGIDIRRPALKLPGWGRIAFVRSDD